VESTQHKLDRIRPPRVQITYDVETGGAIEMKELPFVVGIMSDLSGMRLEPLPKMRDRKFVEIDRDNFNDVLDGIAPHLECTVPNALTGEEGSNLKVELNFHHMDDFGPLSVVDQVEPLKQLLEARQRLVDLLAKLDGNDDLDALLRDVLENTEKLQEVKTQIDGEKEGEGEEKAE
jgi:type VI secretion system protein ImpB